MGEAARKPSVWICDASVLCRTVSLFIVLPVAFADLRRVPLGACSAWPAGAKTGASRSEMCEREPVSTLPSRRGRARPDRLLDPGHRPCRSPRRKRGLSSNCEPRAHISSPNSDRLRLRMSGRRSHTSPRGLVELPQTLAEVKQDPVFLAQGQDSQRLVLQHACGYRVAAQCLGASLRSAHMACLEAAVSQGTGNSRSYRGCAAFYSRRSSAFRHDTLFGCLFSPDIPL